MYHWTDQKIRVPAFYCMLGISLLQYMHRSLKSPGSGCRWKQLALVLAK